MIADRKNSGAKISRDSIFPAGDHNDSYDPFKMEPEQRNIGNGQHKGTICKMALRPQIFPWERIPAIALYIPDPISKMIFLMIDSDFPLDRMAHTDYAVPALHTRDMPKGAHDVIPDFLRFSKF